ncbi:hypothetical protein AB0M28_00830 [Streptomyces sp. NPDC051940]|uniref:hypothetical protein n=1 Tax=Streptomyces sp. NPDC051940 TaxID=3155675 RepID=UPI0034455A55
MKAWVVFRDSAGRVLTTEDLKGFTGTVNWEVTGGEAVPAQARGLHQQAREAGGRGDYERALVLLEQAQRLAPRWPYPSYDAAFTALLQGDAAKAEELYGQVDRLAPRGFFTCKATLDLLRRERAGELFDGFTRAFVQLEWIGDPAEKLAILQGIATRFPGLPQVWKELASLTTDPDDQRRAIENGLAGGPDADTRGTLLISRALLLDRSGDRDGAIRLLGRIALDPSSTLGTESLSKAVLARFF